MTTGKRLAPGVTKEIRALLPTWFACAVAVGVVPFLGDRRIYDTGVLALMLGTVALGALSIGHEYTHRTLPLLLSQPVHRRRLFLTKFAVLTSMIVILAALVWGVLLSRHEFDTPYHYRAEDLRTLQTILFVAVLCGVLIAPWLTMLCRSPLAGLVFTIAIPMVLWLVGEVYWFSTHGTTMPTRSTMESFRLTIVWEGTLILCAVAAVGSWRTFMRLEAMEGRDPEIQLPQWARGETAPIAAEPRADARRRHPLWRLVQKELRLQQMAFVVAGLYLASWGTVALLRNVLHDFHGPLIGPLTILYGGLLAMLIGSLASAEERQFGTLEWQILLPVPAWKQWAVKVGTALSLVWTLAFALPVLLSYLLSSADDSFPHEPYVSALIVLTAGSLYISSFCSSGLRALALSFPVLLGVILLIGPVAGSLVDRLIRLSIHAAPSAWRGGRITGTRWFMPGLPFILPGIFLALVLPFAFVNHRWADRGVRRLSLQAFLILGGLTFGLTLTAVAVTLSRW